VLPLNPFPFFRDLVDELIIRARGVALVVVVA
jgi:hypothetical protein